MNRVENSAAQDMSKTMGSQPPLEFTERAAYKVYELVQEEDPNLKLRVFVTGGGCSGFQYGFEFVEAPNDSDFVIEKTIEEKHGTNRVQFLIDPISLQYLTGAEIDYKEDVRGAQFVIRNPNAQTSCGCGSSFSV